MSVETEIALLKREVDDMKGIHVRLDSAIEKIAEVSSSLHTVIAVHEEKLARQEETLEESEKQLRVNLGFEGTPLILLWRGKQQRALNKEVERDNIELIQKD